MTITLPGGATLTGTAEECVEFLKKHPADLNQAPQEVCRCYAKRQFGVQPQPCKVHGPNGAECLKYQVFMAARSSDIHDDVSAASRILEGRGDQGWELVCVSVSDGRREFYFKRPHSVL